MVVLDESPSMAARDLADESRFATAIEVIRDFVVGRENDAIGVVSFSDRAALRVPKTLDRAALSAALDRLRVMTLGDATRHRHGDCRSAAALAGWFLAGRVIILLTDGENNAGEILPASAGRHGGAKRRSHLHHRHRPRGRCGIGVDRSAQRPDAPRTLSRGASTRRCCSVSRPSPAAATSPPPNRARWQRCPGDRLLERIETRTRVRVVREPHHVELLLAALALLLLEVLLRRSLAAELF